MMDLGEIEAAIECLPERQIEELARWIERRRPATASRRAIDAWLERARGAAIPGVTTDALMAATRGEQ